MDFLVLTIGYLGVGLFLWAFLHLIYGSVPFDTGRAVFLFCLLGWPLVLGMLALLWLEGELP